MSTRARVLLGVLLGVLLCAVLMLIAQTEWQLALAVGWPGTVAWGAPVALDLFAVIAIVANRDVGPAVLVSAASVIISHAVYAAPSVWASGTVAAGHLVWPLAAGFSIVPLLVLWRADHLFRTCIRVTPRVPRAARKSREEPEQISYRIPDFLDSSLMAKVARDGDDVELQRARNAAADIRSRGERLTRDALRKEMGISTARAGDLLRRVG